MRLHAVTLGGMEWWLLAALVVLAPLALLGVVLLGAWRQLRALTSDVGRAGERVGAVSGELQASRRV